jgi:hypothetical protein
MSLLAFAPRGTRRRPVPCRAQLVLERLEDRIVPALLEVVPTLGANGLSTFSSLSLALSAARDGDTIQIEPGSNPGFGSINLSHLTIQGDPAFGGAGGLEATGSVITRLSVQSGGCTLANLYVNTVNIFPFATGVTVANSIFTGRGNGVFQTFSNAPFPTVNGNDTIVGNTFLDDAAVQVGNTPGNASNTAANDRVLNNAFSYMGDVIPITASNETAGLLIAGNRIVSTNRFSMFYQPASIRATDCVGSITGNDIHIASFDVIDVRGSSSAQPTNLTVSSNVLVSPDRGTGVQVIHGSGAGNSFTVSVLNNSLAGISLGVEVVGNGASSGSDFGNITISGNDFRGDNLAILAYDVFPSTSTINAQGNIFSVTDPQTVVSTTFAPGTTINTNNPLTGGSASLDAMPRWTMTAHRRPARLGGRCQRPDAGLGRRPQWPVAHRAGGRTVRLSAGPQPRRRRGPGLGQRPGCWSERGAGHRRVPHLAGVPGAHRAGQRQPQRRLGAEPVPEPARPAGLGGRGQLLAVVSQQ